MEKNITFLELTGTDPDDEMFVNYWDALKKSRGNPKTAQIRANNTNQLSTIGHLTHVQARLSSGKKMEVILYGKGSPILFISGIGMISPIWLYQMKSLSSRHQLIFIHNPGHGFSEISEDLSYKGVSKTIIETIEVLGITSPMHVIGTCLGGNIAIALAARYPQCISLTLVNSVYDYATDAFDTKHLDRQQVAIIMGFLKGFETRLRTDFERSLKECALDSSNYNQRYQLYQKSKNIDPYAYIQYVDSISKNKAIHDLLEGIHQPTLIIAGGRDTVVNNNDSRIMGRLINTAEYQEISDAGHYPYITHPFIFNTTVKTFIENTEIHEG